LSDLLNADPTQDDVDAVAHNLELIVEAGFVKGASYKTLQETLWEHLQLTWKGHEFLDTVRDPAVWRRIKSGGKKAGIFSVEFLWDIGKEIGKQVIKQQLNLA
jgi:hypothetical protein